MELYFDGVPHTELGLALVKGATYDLFPPITENLKYVSGRVGAYLPRSNYKERRFSFPFVLAHAEDDRVLNEHIDALKERFVDGYGNIKQVKLQFSNQLDRYFYVKLTDTSPYNREFAEADITLNFVAVDPYQYGLIDHVLLLDSSGHIEPVLESVAAPLFKLTCYAEEASLLLRFRTSDQVFRTFALEKPNKDPFRVNDVIEIDFATNRVKVNQDDAMYMVKWQESDFFIFPKGTTQITYSPSFQGHASYTPKWL